MFKLAIVAVLVLALAVSAEPINYELNAGRALLMEGGPNNTKSAAPAPEKGFFDKLTDKAKEVGSSIASGAESAYNATKSGASTALNATKEAVGLAPPSAGYTNQFVVATVGAVVVGAALMH